MNDAQHDCTTVQDTRVGNLIKNYEERNEGTFNLLRISRACIMRIYLFGRRALVEADEPVEKVVACGVIACSSLVVREVFFEWRSRKFVGKEIDLVQEEDLRVCK